MTKSPAHPPDQPQAETYELRLKGHLDSRWASRLGVPYLSREGDGTTILSGIATDQAALYGLLQRLRDLGLTLVAVTRIGADAPASSNLENHEPRNLKK